MPAAQYRIKLLEQLLNGPLLLFVPAIVVTEAGIKSVVNPTQPLNALFPMLVNPSSKDIDVKDVQLENEDAPSDVTVSGRIRLVRLVQSRKHSLPTDRMPPFSVTDERELQP